MAKKKLPTGPGISGAPKPNELVVPQAREQLKGLLLRLAIPVLGSWVLCGLLAGVVHSRTWKIVLISVPVVYAVLGGFRTTGQLSDRPVGLPDPWVFDNYPL